MKTNPIIKWAASLEDAYNKGYFTGSMTRWELMERITKYNPNLKWYANATHRGLFDSDKKDKAFICGITHNLTIPKFTIQKHDPRAVRTINYSNAYGDITHKEDVYTGDDEGYVIARSWKTIFNIVKKRGYNVNEKDLY